MTYYLVCAASHPSEESDRNIRESLGAVPVSKSSYKSRPVVVSEEEGKRNAMRLMQALMSMRK